MELIGLWQGHDESNHVGGVKINGVASGKTVIWKEVGTEEELHCSFDYLLWDPLVHFLEFFTCLGILFFFHSGGRLRKFGRRDLVVILSGWSKANFTARAQFLVDPA